jgi:hypothetical protein
MFLFKMLTSRGLRENLSTSDPSGAIFPLRMLKVTGPDHQNGRLWKTNMIHSEVSSCHACTILHSDVLSWTQKPCAEDPPRMQLVMLKTLSFAGIYI